MGAPRLRSQIKLTKGADRVGVLGERCLSTRRKFGAAVSPRWREGRWMPQAGGCFFFPRFFGGSGFGGFPASRLQLGPTQGLSLASFFSRNFRTAR
jgi:hypothetical protein